jgi:hypothetical protein
LHCMINRCRGTDPRQQLRAPMQLVSRVLLCHCKCQSRQQEHMPHLPLPLAPRSCHECLQAGLHCELFCLPVMFHTSVFRTLICCIASASPYHPRDTCQHDTKTKVKCSSLHKLAWHADHCLSPCRVMTSQTPVQHPRWHHLWQKSCLWILPCLLPRSTWLYIQTTSTEEVSGYQQQGCNNTAMQMCFYGHLHRCTGAAMITCTGVGLHLSCLTTG